MPIACGLTSKARGAIANIPNMIRRKKRFRWTKAIYRERNHVEALFFRRRFSSAVRDLEAGHPLTDEAYRLVIVPAFSRSLPIISILGLCA